MYCYCRVKLRSIDRTKCLVFYSSLSNVENNLIEIRNKELALGFEVIEVIQEEVTDDILIYCIQQKELVKNSETNSSDKGGIL